MKIRALFFLLALSVFAMSDATAAEVRIAIASNFRSTMTSLVNIFEARSAHKVIASYGSTGKHYAQILNGAPYDLFFAADEHRPQLLEEQGLLVLNSRYTYAVGKLVLWSPNAMGADLNATSLDNTDVRHIALANAKLAPYGRAAEQVLAALELDKKLTAKLVRGENIAQTYQFVVTGNAELGFVANSQIIASGSQDSGSVWNIPQKFYEPIKQQAVMIKETAASRDFYAFMQSDTARNIIRQDGYKLPPQPRR
ncbi:molybdate ABC transporter substrate-binding protein [Arenicella sp.]|nr:molybdate ABC transporter substrate-binding protein [Arenicella sp.]